MPEDKNLQSFLRDLTEASRKYNIAIADEPVLCTMEKEDAGLAYICNDEGRLQRIEE
jgi:uncharacterized protein YlxP (DUF503 family)